MRIRQIGFYDLNRLRDYVLISIFGERELKDLKLYSRINEVSSQSLELNILERIGNTLQAEAFGDFQHTSKYAKK